MKKLYSYSIGIVVLLFCLCVDMNRLSAQDFMVLNTRRRVTTTAARVQECANTMTAEGSSVACTGSTVVTGHAICGFVSFADGGGSISLTSVTSNASAQAATLLDTVQHVTFSETVRSFYYLSITGSPTTFTANFSGSTVDGTITWVEVSGVTALDVHTGQLQTSPGTGTDGVTSGNVTAAAGLVCGGAVDTSATRTANYSLGTGFTNLAQAGGTSSVNAAIESKVTTGGTQAATFTAANNDSTIAMILVLK